MHLEENSKLDDPAHEQIDFTAFSPLRSQIDLSPTCYVGSPYACDFGNDINGFHFLDGTGEQDISISELLVEALHNPDESSCEESTYQENPVVGRAGHLSEHTQLLQNIPPGSSYNGSYSDTDTDTAQVSVIGHFISLLSHQVGKPSCLFLFAILLDVLQTD